MGYPSVLCEVVSLQRLCAFSFHAQCWAELPTLHRSHLLRPAKIKILWLNEGLEWDTLDGEKILTTGAVTWFDEGTPWAAFRAEEVVYNVDVREYIRVKGPSKNKTPFGIIMGMPTPELGNAIRSEASGSCLLTFPPP